MLTRIQIKNFKRFETVEFELGKTVVLIGPNNSGKTTALQALALWDIGLRRWNEKWGGKKSPEQRPGVTINRRDLISIPVPSATLLWRDLHVREIERTNGRQRTQNIRIDITVDGVTEDKSWSCGFEFDFSNAEVFFCRPLRLNEDQPPQRMPVPSEAANVKVAYLPPMSGMADREFIKQPGEIGVLIGQGQTAQVLRNLCYRIYGQEGDAPKPEWEKLTARIHKLFGVKLLPPEYIKERSEIIMSYQEPGGLKLDISSSGRGLQQTLLLLAHLYANPQTVLLLDEPDAHLEVLRQRQTYQLLSEVADQQGSQIIAASHSEVVLNEAAGRDVVIAFVGKPHPINGQPAQVRKALTELGFDQYYQAEQRGWVLYLEGSTDLVILQTFAAKLEHPAADYLERPFVHYVATNLPEKARDHFRGLFEAKPDLVGLALFDRLGKILQAGTPLTEIMWSRREIENYFCRPEVLLAYARGDKSYDLFVHQHEQIMQEVIDEVSTALKTLGKPDPWSPDVKASDDFLAPLFRQYFEKLGIPNLMRKADYHELARLLPRDQIDPEVVEKLDAIVVVAKQAKPLES